MPVCLEYKKYFPKILGLLWLICFLGGVGLHTSQAKDTFKDMVIKKQISARGLDPHAYSTAQQMYCVAPFKEMDENGNALLTEFEQAMQTGALWNFPQSVERIMALEPYRNNQDLRNRIVSHTKTVFDKDFIPKDRLSDCITAFAEANQLYRDGNFKDAADLYLSILAAEPENKEARNNFSLSHMHMGNDLIAWANLHMLTQKYSNYVPAWVNLTVVLERLDESDSAKQAMLKAIELESDRPDTSAQVLFNQAWFSAIDGKMYTAKTILDPINSSSKLTDKYHAFDKVPEYMKTKDEIVRDTLKEESSGFWSQGLAGICGGTKAWWAYVISNVIFFILMVLAGVAVLEMWDIYSDIAPFGLFFSTAFCYLLFWGLPTGIWEWIWVVALSFIMMKIQLEG